MNRIIIALYKYHLTNTLENSYAMSSAHSFVAEALITGDEADFWNIYESNRMYIYNKLRDT